MKFFQQLLFYCILTGTAIYAVFSVYVAIFKNSGNNPYFLKQIFAFCSVLTIFLLYKAYQAGEVQSDLSSGIKWVLLSWVPYVFVTIVYVLLAKMMG